MASPSTIPRCPKPEPEETTYTPARVNRTLAYIEARLTSRSRKPTPHAEQVLTCLEDACFFYKEAIAITGEDLMEYANFDVEVRGWEVVIHQCRYLQEFAEDEQAEEELKNDILKLRQGFYYARYGDRVEELLKVPQDRIRDIGFDAEIAASLKARRDWKAFSKTLEEGKRQWQNDRWRKTADPDFDLRMPEVLVQLHEVCDKIGLDFDATCSCVHRFGEKDGECHDDVEHLIQMGKHESIASIFAADLVDLHPLFGYAGVE